MKNFTLGLVLLALAVVPLTGQAAEFYSGKAYLLAKESVTEGNLYVGAERADIRGQVSGDLVLVGGDITITGPVVDDVLIGGGTVKLMAPVEGDARLVGGTISLASRVAGDVLIFGGQVSIEPTAEIGGDVIVYGGSIKITGPVQGNIRIIGGDVSINSTIGGQALVQSERLTIGESGVVTGDLDYRSGNKNGLVNNGKILGKTKIEADPILPEEKKVGAFLAALASTWLVLRILMVILGALAIYFLFRYRLTQAVEETLARPWRALLIGFILMVVAPVLVVVLLASVLGILFAGVLFLIYLVMMLMAYVLAGTFFGAWAYKVITKGSGYIIDWRTIVLGTLGLTVIGFVPVLGWLVCLGFFLVALAALVERFYRLLTE